MGRDPHAPHLIHDEAYDELVREGLEAYERLFGDDLGPGGWSNVNAALLEEAIEARPAGRLLVTFEARRKHWLLDRLREREDVVPLDARAFLPARGAAPARR